MIVTVKRERLVASLVVLALVPSVVADSCAAPIPLGPDGPDFYMPPSILPDGDHGSLVWYRPYEGGSSALSVGTNTLLLYTQVGVHGNTVATSGSMAVPDGEAPPEGWPIVTWAHGTTGIADQCAPTINDTASDQTVNARLLADWVSRGYAVLRTDYEGLGTPGDHPYLIGASEARAVLDIVRAARQYEPRLDARRVVVSGHSQGGHAALWAAALAAEYTPELGVLATVAFAPANSLGAEVPLLHSIGNTTALSGTVALVVRGLAVANSSLLHAMADDTFWTPTAAALFPQTLTQCSAFLDSDASYGAVGADNLLAASSTAADAALADVVAQLRENDPTYLTSIPQPVLVLQGSSDTTVFPFTTAAMVKNLAAGGVDIVEQVYAGATHQTIIEAASANATAYLESTFNTLRNGEWVPSG